MEDKVKQFVVFKNINPPAKIIGLFYNTFFVFVLISVLVFLGSSGKGIMGIVIAVIFIAILYVVLFFFQTKFGPKKVKLYVNYFLHPINHITVKKSFKR